MSHMRKLGAVDYLRTVAIARIALDNVPNLQSSWVTMGLKIGQLALRFGCNDFGSLMIEENVVSSAGTTFNEDFGLTTEQGEGHGLSVFVRDGDAIYRTYFTSSRGTESVPKSRRILPALS